MTTYILPNIRTLLRQGFSDVELRRLCFDVPGFRPVYDSLSSSAGKDDIIDRLLEYAEHQLQLAALLGLARQANAGRYDLHGPYTAGNGQDPAPQPAASAGPRPAGQSVTLPNPFVDGPPVPPAKFIGREREVDVILDRLANPNNRGGSTVSGCCGLGKTSLLHYLLDDRTRARWPALHPDLAHFVYIPTGLIFPFSEMGFWEYLFNELNEWLGPTPEIDRIMNTLELGRLPSRVSITRFFTRLGESEEKKFAVVLLDGFDLLMGEINKGGSEAGLGFLHTLRALLNLPAPRGFSLVTSSERELFDLFANVSWFGSGFYSNMANLPLAPFDNEQTGRLIDSYLAGTGLTFDASERESLVRASRGHPKRLQQAAYKLFEKKIA